MQHNSMYVYLEVNPIVFSVVYSLVSVFWIPWTKYDLEMLEYHKVCKDGTVITEAPLPLDAAWTQVQQLKSHVQTSSWNKPASKKAGKVEENKAELMAARYQSPFL